QLDALHAEGTLLHDTTRPNGDVGIQYHLTQHGVHGRVDILELTVVVVVEPVEAAYFIRTVVCTIAGTDATVVCHLVEPLGAVCGGRHRADSLARCIIAMLAKHGLEYHLRILSSILKFPPVVHRRIAAVVAVDTQPVHFTAVDHFLAAHERHVVLYVTRHHASATSNTGIQVDGHRPVVVAVLVAFPHGKLTRSY